MKAHNLLSLSLFVGGGDKVGLGNGGSHYHILTFRKLLSQ